MKALVYLISALLIGICSILAWNGISSWSVFGVKSIKTEHAIVLKEIGLLGKLELAKYSFKDIVEQELVQDFLPNPKAILIVQGEATGCIDLSKIKKEDIETIQDSLILILPAAELCYFKIDHSKSKIFDTEYAFLNEELLLNAAYQRAEEKIKASALEMGILKQTENNANLILKPMIEKLSNKKVRLKFKH